MPGIQFINNGRWILKMGWIFHLLFWGLSFYILLRIFQLSSEIYPIDYIYTLFFHVSLVAGVYLNLKLLIPWLLRRKKYGWYLLLFVVLLFMVSEFHVFLFETLIDRIFPDYYFISYYDFVDILKFHLIYLTLSTLLKLSQEWFSLLDAKRNLSEAEKEKTQNELLALRSQLNPHFLFNSLNSIYSLSMNKAESTPKTIMALSEILRYVIYETGEEYVLLEQEIKFLHKYIELQKLRTDTPDNIQFVVEGETQQFRIAPLLLLPIVENGCKHGLRGRPGTNFLHISIKIDEGKFFFSSKNNKVAIKDVEDARPAGIGLQNVKRRLELLYPAEHKMKVIEHDSEFEIYLEISLA